jgi:hypothetical protein
LGLLFLCLLAVLTSNGCISFVDLQKSCITGQLQLPGCRAVSFSTDPRANTMAVVCSDGLLRLFDLAVVRAKQQAHSFVQLKRLQEVELQQLSANADSLPASSKAGPSASGQSAGARGSKVLSDVGNVELGSRAGKAKGTAEPAAAGGSGGPTAAGQQLHVRQLSQPAAALNRRKLQEILLAYGEFPARYRRLIW